MYHLKVRPEIDKLLFKLSKKSKVTFEAINKKVEEIIKNPHHYKNLKAPLQHLKRVHIMGSHVITFSVDEATKTVILEDFDHHDKVYLQ